MSWQIPTQIEQDIIAGKATYRTFQTGNGGQSILPVPANAYVVIFGYDFSPAGGGLAVQSTQFASATNSNLQSPEIIRWFETQQIAFYTGTDFYPFIHHVNTNESAVLKTWDGTAPDDVFAKEYRVIYGIDNTPLARQVYITSSNDVTITHGLVLGTRRATGNTIPVTNRTPPGLTYGGTGQTINTQTDFGPGVSPLQFMQPSPKDYQDFAFGLLPANADGQAFATPDTAFGLRDASQYLNSVSSGYLNSASANYFLCLHYALYNKPIPSKQG
jgi:hypothetical protein